MHILYIVQYFNSPDDPGGSRAYEFARRWAVAGHRVTLLAGNLNHKTLSTITTQTTTPAGVRLLRVRTYNSIRGSYVKRIANFISFALGATTNGLRVRDVDVVYASSTPLTTAIAGFVLSSIKRARFVFEVRDLWPESAVVAGVLKRGWLTRLIESFERFLYKRAFTLVALSDGIRDGIIARGATASRVVMVPNGVDDWMIDTPLSPIRPFPVNKQEHFVCTYVGALGRWNSLETLLDAAKLLEGSRVRFLIIGDGDHRDELRHQARTLGLTNVIFHGPVAKKEVLSYLTASDLCVLCTWADSFLGTVLQNKIFDYMAAARPTLGSVHGELARIIQASDCGWVSPAGSSEEFARMCLELSASDPSELQRRGANGRAFVELHYKRSQLADRALEAFTTSLPRALTSAASDRPEFKNINPGLMNR
jgi:glycosyltransferase involved in cell wall biosynthesis